MTLEGWMDRAGGWFRDSGPEGDVVVSSRVRLARNLAGYPFVPRTSVTQRRDLMETCHRRIWRTSLASRLQWISLDQSQPLDRLVLAERHLISRQHSKATGGRAVAVSEDESLAIMVNEEDHLRLQVLRGGMRLREAFDAVNQVDDTLESSMQYAFSSGLGYLTACPTNVGTGIRVSVMLHLPALRITKEIDRLRRAAADMHLAVRGFHGEGSESVGDFFQLSNQTTLGRREIDFLHDFERQVIPQAIEYERTARRALCDRRAVVLDDRVHRAWAILTHARLLSTEEAMALLSAVRLGICLERLPGVKLASINELFLLAQPGHLQKIAGQPIAGAERREFRAAFIRQRLGV